MAKIEKPTPKQNVEIQRRLRKKHPHMGTENWVSKLKRKVKAQVRAGDTLKRGENKGTRNKIDRMRSQGMTDKEIGRFMGKKA